MLLSVSTHSTGGIGLVFQNNDLADKFALSLKKSGTIYIKNENYVEVLMIHFGKTGNL